MADESMAHAMQVRNEISEKKKRVYHLRRRNIEISEKTKHVEDLGHDVRTDIYRKIIAAIRLGGLAGGFKTYVRASCTSSHLDKTAH